MDGEEGGPIEVPLDALQPETLQRIIEEFVLREGTEYGPGEYSLEGKVEAVQKALRQGKAVLFYDPKEGTSTIVQR